MSQPGLIYRLEFKNIEGFTVRTDIYPTDKPLNSGIIHPTEALFYTSLGLNYIAVFYNLGSFFYIGQVFTISGTASNNGVFTVVSVTGYGSSTIVEVAQTVVVESAFASTFTDNSVITVPTIIPLQAGGTPLIISASNNDEDKFTPIRSKSAQIQFVTDTSAGLDSSTFSQGADNLWKVEIYLQDTPQLIFQGFLMMADNHQPFQPDPQYVTLTATDHLAALKEAALVDFNDINPIGKYRVADLIAMCLRKTGLELSFFVVNNLRAGSGILTNTATISSSGQYIVVNTTNFFYPGQEFTLTGTATHDGTYHVDHVVQSIVTEVHLVENITAPGEVAPSAVFTDTASSFHWYDNVYIDAKTFEKIIGSSENCYTVLSKLLGEDCYITQWHGQWFIMRVDEIDNNPFYIAEFTAAGVYVSTATDDFSKSVGAAEDYRFANADTLLRFVRPHQFVKETFNYDFPAEIPCNKDFSRGDYVSGTNPKLYDITCWTKRRGVPGGYNAPITITAFIQRTFNDNDYEIDRLIYITPQTGHTGFSSTDDEYIESEGIPVNISDKFEGSIQWKFNTNIGSSAADLRLFRFILIGDDGSGWILGEATPGDGKPVWYDTSGFTGNTGKGATPVVFGSQDETEWQSIDWNAPPIPMSGTLYIWLNQAYTNAAVPSGEIISYANLRFDYIPLINGTYSRTTGQSTQVTRTNPDGYIVNRDNEVFVSDSPLPIAKGSMFLLIGGAYKLFPNWFRSINGLDTGDIHPFGYLQAYSVWNQYKGVNDPITGRGIGINIFSGSVLGLTDSWPDVVNKFSLTDMNTQTNNRNFMLISVQQDWKLCQWTATFIEVFNTEIGKTYTDPFSFRYLTE